jgi:hypothetical protein
MIGVLAQGPVGDQIKAFSNLIKNSQHCKTYDLYSPHLALRFKAAFFAICKLFPDKQIVICGNSCLCFAFNPKIPLLAR